eukprot:10046197-Prorocentrum_lima.AAC.1
MKRVLNAEYGPDLTISNAADMSFSALDMAVLWDSFPKLNSRLIQLWIPATHDDRAVRLCLSLIHI